MLQGIKNNIFSVNLNKDTKRIKPSEDVQAIKDKLLAGTKVDELSKEEYIKLSVFEDAEMSEFFVEITEEMTKVEAIAKKIAKGEVLTAEEEHYINEKNPDIKRDAENAKKEAEDLKGRIKNSKSSKERKQIIANAIIGVAQMSQDGIIAPLQARIKLEAIEKVKKDVGETDINTSEFYKNKKDIEAGAFIEKWS